MFITQTTDSKVTSKNKSKGIRVTKVFLTYSQVKDDDFHTKLNNLAVSLCAKRFVLCRELHEDKGIHFHAFMDFAMRRRFQFENFDIDNYHANIQKADINVIGYIMKDYQKYPESLVNFFGFSMDELMNAKKNYEMLQTKKITSKSDSTRLKDLKRDIKYYELLAGKIDVVDWIYKYPSNFVKYTSIKNNVNTFFNDLYKKIDRFSLFDRLKIQNYWIYGETGVGKTYVSHRLWPNHFIKNPYNKWFDGYTNQTTIIIEEKNDHTFPESILRMISDSYALTVEVKGSFVALKHFRIVVLSQKSIKEFYDKNDFYTPADRENILRRFTQIDANHFYPGKKYFTIPDFKIMDFEAFDLSEQNCKDLGFNFSQISEYAKTDPIQLEKLKAVNEFKTLIQTTFNEKIQKLGIPDPFYEYELLQSNKSISKPKVEKQGSEEIPYIDLEIPSVPNNIDNQTQSVYDKSFVDDNSYLDMMNDDDDQYLDANDFEEPDYNQINQNNNN